MRQAIALVFVFLVMATGAFGATCQGRNLLPDLDPAERGSLDAIIARVPFAKGNAWRATRGDEVVTLVGTYHFDDPRFDAVMERHLPEIRAARTVLVEAGREETEALRSATEKDPSLLFTLQGPTLPERLSEEEWQQLSTALAARGIPPFLGSKMKPWYVSVLLAVAPCAVPGLTKGADGLDARVIDAALGAGVPVRALEPYDTAIRIFREMGAAQEIRMLRQSLVLEEDAENMSATLLAAYFDEEPRLIWEFSRLMSYRTDPRDRAAIDADYAEIEEVLMVRRNRSWIPVIAGAAKAGPVFAAFGALHLSGDKGVLALLAQEGFVIERIAY